MSKKLISIVVPVFNEEETVAPFHAALVPTLRELEDRHDFEILFTDNHSTDTTMQILADLAAKDRRIRVIRFSRNFGYQRSIYAGFLNCRGEAAIQLDVDLQDPPSMIGKFLEEWANGYDVVYGIRRSRKEGIFTHALRRIFYRLIDTLSEDCLPLDAGDFRLISRRVIEELRQQDDSQPYLRGAVAAIGFEQLGIPYDRAERTRGYSKFSFLALFGLALDGILNHSIVPLRISTFLGLAVSLVTFSGMAGYLIGKFFFGQEGPAGFATLTVLILFSASLNAVFLGIIGEYLGRIYKQVKKKPICVIEREINRPVQERSAAGNGE